MIATDTPNVPEVITATDTADRIRLHGRMKAGEIEQLTRDTFRVRTPAERIAWIAAEAQREQEHTAREREQQQREARERALRHAQNLWERSEVPERYLAADLRHLPADTPDGYRGTAAKLAEQLADPGMVALVGIRGSGKTELACGLIREFCRSRKSARYVRTLEVFRRIRSTWGRKRGESTETDVVDDLRSVDLLVLDEMQVRSDTEWENNILADLIDARYAALRSTVIIANLEPKALAANLGASITSRLRETGNIIPCAWESFRNNGKARRPEVPTRDQHGRYSFPPVIDGATPTDPTRPVRYCAG